MAGSISSSRMERSRSSVPSSSMPTSRLSPTTSAASTAESLRSTRWVSIVRCLPGEKARSYRFTTAQPIGARPPRGPCGSRGYSSDGCLAAVLRDAFCYRRRKPLPRKGPESFPSWTPPVRPRSPASLELRYRKVGLADLGWATLLVRDRRARRGRQRDHAHLAEPDLRAPGREVSAGEVEGVAELDQHVERHHESEGVLPAGVVDEVLDRHEGSPGGKRVVGGSDQVELLLEVPVVQDHAHRDHIRPG